MNYQKHKNAKAAATHDSYKSTTKPHVSQPICVDQALSSTACSISSQEIANFSPEYFHGYKLHTACNNCTRKEHFKVPEPSPFSAFLYCEMPSSLVTHWLSPHQLSISASNSSCASLRSHCVKWPSPGELLYTADDILRELMDRMKKSKWWTEHQERECQNQTPHYLLLRFMIRNKLPKFWDKLKIKKKHSVRKWKDIMRFEIRYFFS